MGSAGRLLDRDRQASDQPRHFVELSGIVMLERPCKTGEAFVVAHRRYVVRNDRRYCAVELNDRHQITSRIKPAKQASCRNKTFWRPACDAGEPAARWNACVKCRRRAANRCGTSAFQPGSTPPRAGLFPLCKSRRL